MMYLYIFLTAFAMIFFSCVAKKEAHIQLGHVHIDGSTGELRSDLERLGVDSVMEKITTLNGRTERSFRFSTEKNGLRYDFDIYSAGGKVKGMKSTLMPGSLSQKEFTDKVENKIRPAFERTSKGLRSVSITEHEDHTDSRKSYYRFEAMTR